MMIRVTRIERRTAGSSYVPSDGRWVKAVMDSHFSASRTGPGSPLVDKARSGVFS